MMNLTTKREVLQESSKVFDPIRLTAPVIIRSKLLMQKLWQHHIEWDEPLDNELHTEWQTIVEDIKQLPHFYIRRPYFTTTFDTHGVELHLFAGQCKGICIWFSRIPHAAATNLLCYGEESGCST